MDKSDSFLCTFSCPLSFWLEIIDIMNNMNTTAWMAMAGAVLAPVVLGSQLPEEQYHQIQQHLPSLTLQPTICSIKYYMISKKAALSVCPPANKN